jgi:hypothetical protein
MREILSAVSSQLASTCADPYFRGVISSWRMPSSFPARMGNYTPKCGRAFPGLRFRTDILGAAYLYGEPAQRRSPTRRILS